MRNNILIAFLIGLIFFVVGLFTLPDYGINWDTINHLPRGQVYLHYFLTGSKDFSNLPPYFRGWQEKGEWYWQKSNTLFFEPDIAKENIPRLSLYQVAGVNFDYFMERDGGHPPLSDIISSFFNFILFQKLGLVNDIDSYRVYGVLLAAILVGLIYYWVTQVYGRFAGFVASLSLSLYPFFWSESHFNTEKDIPETAYWSFFLFAIWQGVRNKSWKWILGSGVFFGLALGTKFNVVFVGFVIIPWLIFYARKLIKPKFIFSSLGAILIAIAIFVGSWPFLWADPIFRIQKVVGFYTGIGLSQGSSTNFIGPFGTNTYALAWILYATPIAILVLLSIGLFRATRDVSKDKTGFLLLVVLWLIVPIARVTWPGMTIYGGIRQIMEYIPAVAILSGVGALAIRDYVSVKWRKLAIILIIAAFIPITIKMVQIHPNENNYFNPIIGGLSGAKEKNFPFWGNSFGAAYRQAINWLNTNAEKGAGIAYAYELIPNMPRILLRTDLNLQNRQRSGYLRKGEYVITLPYQGTEKRSYFDMYLREFLNPVYEAKVDGVSVVTIWKNEDKYLKKPWIEKVDNRVILDKNPGEMIFDLGEERKISRLEINYSEYRCTEMKSGLVRISKDATSWTGLPGALPQDWLIPVLGQQPMNGKFIYPFVGQEMRYIAVIFSPNDTCLSRNIQTFKVFYLE